MCKPVVKVFVGRDESAESPRDWDNFGVMACWHRHYTLGDVQPKVSPEEWLKDNAPKGSVVLPLYLMDHSGLSMSTGSFGCPWDSGQVGWIVATPKKIKEWLGVKRITKKVREKAEVMLKAEVDTYNCYLQGDVWGYTIDVYEKCDKCGSSINIEKESDSCWGFIGTEALDAMKDHVPEKYHKLLEEAWEKRS